MKRVFANKTFVLGLMLAALLALLGISLSVGSMHLSLFSLLRDCLRPEAARSKNFSVHAYIVTNVRLPRIALCTLTGIALGLSGCIMQNLLRNPLASPFTLGVSSGASFGAALAMVLGVGVFNANFLFSGYSLVAFNAFVFGCISLLIVSAVARISRNDMGMLILTGTAVNSLFSAGVSILKYASGAEALKNLDTWLMGGFWGSNWRSVTILSPIVFVGFLLLVMRAWDFNAMNAGEDVAGTLGVNVRRLRVLALLVVTLVASTTIAFSGIIGFIGLVAPHIARSLIGVDNRHLIPASAMLGAIVLLLSDTVARTMFSPQEIPVGIITAVLGVPFFLLILRRRRKQMWM
ncbi:MAG: FecCD family ABC transporter permease [Christensenellales bacterium]|jgi:iron complex transport system permease protein